ALTEHRGPPMRCAWSRDSSLLASAEDDAGVELDPPLEPARVIVYRTDGLHRVEATLVHPRAVVGVEFTPDGRYLLTACGDGHVRVFALPSDKPVTDIDLGGRVLNADLSSDGERILACSTNGVVGIWRRDGDLLQKHKFDRQTQVRYT